MIKTIFNHEKQRIFWLLLVFLLVGMTTGRYLFAVFIVLIAYIGWLLWHIYTLTQWASQSGFENLPLYSPLLYQIAGQLTGLKKQVIDTKKQQKKIIVRFNEIGRTFPYPIILINKNHEIVWVSKTAAKILSLNRKKDIGIRIHNIIRHAPFHLMLEQSCYNEFEIKLSGAIFIIAISPLYKDTRLLSIRDVSKKYRLDQFKKTFIANASHELCTPLTTVNGYLKILSSDTSLTSQQQDMVNKAYDQTQNMSNLITDLLLSNLDNAQQTQAQQSINLGDMIDKTLEKIHNQKTISQTLKLELNKKLTFWGLESRWQSVVTNLLENSIKYSQKDGTINISWQQIDGQFVFEMSDSGKGFSAGQLSSLTQSFYRLPEHSHKQGTGLGLSIVAQVIQQHQGQLYLTESKQLGLKIMIKLPIKR